MKALVVALSLALSVAALPAAGEVYQWTDKDGKVHFTGDLSQVPPDQRAGAAKPAKSGRGSLQRAVERKPEVETEGRRPAAGRSGGQRGGGAALREERVGHRTEAQWRAEAKRYRDAIKRLEKHAASCQGDSFRWSRGAGRRAYREEVAEADACMRTKNDLERNRRELEKFQQKAHRAGAPPGWMRE